MKKTILAAALFILTFMSCGRQSAAYGEINNSAFVPLTVDKTNVRLRSGPGTQSRIVGLANPDLTVIAEKWLVFDEEANMSWYRIVGFLDTETGGVYDRLDDLRAPCYVSAELVRETSYTEVGYSEEAVMQQLALTPYGQGYSAVDASPETQRRMAEQQTLKRIYQAKGTYERAITIYAEPSKSSGELKVIDFSVKEFYDYELFATDDSKAGWLFIVSVTSRCPSGWVEANLFDIEMQYDYVRIGTLITLNLGANVPDMMSRWGPEEVVERKAIEDWNGHLDKTKMAFDGLEVRYENYRNFGFTLTRKGAGTDGIVIGVSWCNQAYIEKTFCKPLSLQSQRKLDDGSEYWTIAGGPDGWQFEMTIYFDKQGIVQKLQYGCHDVDVS